MYYDSSVVFYDLESTGVGGEPGAGVAFYDSAARHGVSRLDALHVMNHARIVVVLRQDPLKLLYIGFDSAARPREVITDTSATTGLIAVIHADTLTPSYREFL